MFGKYFGEGFRDAGEGSEIAGCRLYELSKSMKFEEKANPDIPIGRVVDFEALAKVRIPDGEIPEILDPRTKYEIDGKIYETDDNGMVFKTEGRLNPNTEYTINGTTYETDSRGRIVSWQGHPNHNPDQIRDEKAQLEVGGDDRQKGDVGAHIVARELDGSPGIENLTPMRDTINSGDYKKSENEIVKARDAGKDVKDSGRIIYEGDSSRPSKIERTYEIDGVKKELTIDNVEGSQDLLDDVKGEISDSDYENLKDRIEGMEGDGSEVSVTSVLKEYDKDGNLVSETVGIRDETNGTKSYIKYDI